MVTEESPSAKPKDKINVGVEHVRKVDVHFCELCKMYLPRGEEDSFLLAKHCSNRTHLQKYVRFKEDRELRKQAERLQRKETAEKADRKDKVKVSGVFNIAFLIFSFYKTHFNVLFLSFSQDKKDDKERSSKGVEGSNKKDKSEKEMNGDEKKASGPMKDDDDEAQEDKLWADDVDKDLKDLIDEAHAGNKSSDEDSHAGGERYDR